MAVSLALNLILGVALFACVAKRWRHRQPKTIRGSELPAGSRVLGIKILCGGTSDTTRVIDGEGRPLLFEGVTASQWHMLLRLGEDRGQVKCVIDGVPIEYFDPAAQPEAAPVGA